jgi:hypothetical protein
MFIISININISVNVEICNKKIKSDNIAFLGGDECQKVVVK